MALLWTSMPWEGPLPWQKTAMDLVVHWMEATGSLANIPPDLADTLAREPHLTVLAGAGFELLGSYEFTAPHSWTIESLAGFAYSTSVLSRAALGKHVKDFEKDLRGRLLSIQPSGIFEESVKFRYDLAVSAAARAV